MQITFAAETVSASNVLDDLSLDPTFSADNYPSNQKDYSLQIITIAESKDKELLLYVYQPATSQDFRSNYISMSLTVNDSIAPNIYSLTYCNHSGTLYKYKVNDFEVSSDEVRHYEIYSILRPFATGIDDEVDFDQTVGAVPFSVSKAWELGEINGNSYIECKVIETIEITDKFVGFVRYSDGFKLNPTACDSHFVAFSTDRPIDELLEADVYYTYQTYSQTTGLGINNETFGEKQSDYAYPKSINHVDYTGNGWFAGTYQWDRIETVEQFKSEVDFKQNVYAGVLLDVSVVNKITDDGIKALEDKQWVLRFTETEYGFGGGAGGATWERAVRVGDVSILRLKFVYNGKPYNLGVIDNMQTGSTNPINTTETIVEMSDMLKMILGIVALILFVAIVIAIVVLIKPVGDFLKFICKLIWSIITAPFRFIAWLFGGSKKQSKSYKKRRRR